MDQLDVGAEHQLLAFGIYTPSGKISSDAPVSTHGESEVGRSAFYSAWPKELAHGESPVAEAVRKRAANTCPQVRDQERASWAGGRVSSGDGNVAEVLVDQPLAGAARGRISRASA